MPKLFSDRPPLNAVLQEKAQKIRYSCSPSKCLHSLLSFLPIITWLPKYDWSHSFFGDLSGGLTMAVFSVPQGIALASITGVPPVYGLYTAIFPSFLYIFFGTSKHNALGKPSFDVLFGRSLFQKKMHTQKKRNLPILGGFAVLSLMTHGAIEKVMLRTATSYNATAYVNHTLDELFDRDNDTIITNTTLMQILGNETSFVEEVTMEMWTEGVTPVKQIHVATTIIFLAGIIQVLMGVFRLQYLTSLFSEQVMSGFVVGGGVHVFFAQIGNMLGIELPRRNGPGYLYYPLEKPFLLIFQRIWDLIENLDNVHIPTVSISMSSFLFLVISKEYLAPWFSSAFNYPVPFELLLVRNTRMTSIFMLVIKVVVGITATDYAELSRRHDVKVVGNIPTEFPPPSLPRFDLIRHIGLNAVAIAITAVAIHITVAKVVEKRYKYKINHGQELYALGFVGVLSSFFPVFPVTSGFARSVVGAAVGGSTQLTCLFSSLALLSVILYIGTALKYLPQCILSAMIIFAQKGMFEKFGELKSLWPVFKIDFAIWLMSFFLTVCYDMGEGLLMAIGFAVLTTIIRTQRPKWHFLSRDDETESFKETKKRDLERIQGNVCIFRMDAPLIFTSSDRFTMSVWQCVKKWERCKSESFVTIEQMNSDKSADIFDSKLKAARRRWKRDQKSESRCKLVIDCDGFPYVDYLGLSTLKSVYVDLQAAGVQCYFVVQKSELKRLFRATDFYDVVDEARVFNKVADAVKAAEQNISSLKSAKEVLTALASIATTDTILIDEEDIENEESSEIVGDEGREEEEEARRRAVSEHSEEIMSETSVSIGEARSTASSRNSINSDQ
ncbi:Protein CBR-SULP-3 [Caenorhabditis briggsae]|uniref:Protein CBR-SULP-3 n=1 Tax=Caenorhabditis briggsae TaxID=6238 RepID=A8Y340_CAEBR|nr:Protein CBR-SULP-3 [Caenorhabditis briggsae]CAP39277.2 Protein CBR-SULP-3 [Caenorhabditis briggsae]